MSPTDREHDRARARQPHHRGRLSRAHAGLGRLAAQARGLFPSGITHDGRHLEPYGVYVERGEGAVQMGRRWQPLHRLLRRPRRAAARPQPSRGRRRGRRRRSRAAPISARAMPLEVRWAEAIRGLMPSAERIRFTSSGTEATLMAVRLARSFTGRRKILRIRTHFHGWHDHMTRATSRISTARRPWACCRRSRRRWCWPTPTTSTALRRVLAADRDIAAAIVEPTGGSFGMVPLAPSFLTALRELTAAHGVLLILDEVVTGFRVAPGGAQGHFGITPDLTSARQDRRGRPAGRRRRRARGRARGRSISRRAPPPGRRKSSIPAPSTPIRSRPRPASRRWT